MDYSQQIGEFWKRHLWAGVIASESLSLQEDVEDSEIRALYQYMPVQAAANNMFEAEQYPYLRELCTLEDEGMQKLMPDGSRGRKRILILVSDSTTVFVAGKKTQTNILSDLASAKNGSLAMYTEIIYERLWGKTLTEISSKIINLVDQTIVRYGISDPELSIDCIACWQGNELVGRRGIFVQPGPTSWWDNQSPITAEGNWGKICTRCFQNINALAEMQRRFPQVAIVQLLSGIRGFVYGLPKQFDECMRTIFDEAARKGLAVVSMHSYCGDLPLYTDGYHFREDSQSRRKLIAGIAHGLHLSVAEHYAKNAILADRPNFLELQNNHRFDPSGRYLVDSRALTESLRRLARQKPTQATPTENASIDHDEPNPWEDEWFEAKREEVHASMPAVTTEELAAAIEKHNVMRIDQYRWARVDEVDESGRVAKAPRKEEAGTQASSSASASADIQAAGPQEHVWGDSILKTTQSDERAAKRAKKDKRLADLARSEQIAAQGAANLRRWEDCSYYSEMTGTVLYDYWNASPSKDEADNYLIVNQSDMTGGLAKPKIDHGVRNFLTGLVRGNFMDKGHKFALHSWDGPWVLAMEVLEVVNRVKRVGLGLGTLLEVMYHDNKGRFSYRGPINNDADTIGQPAFPVYVRCVHGHHENLASQFNVEEIAVGWLSPYTTEELDSFDDALREERPIIPIDKSHGGSGKAHNYFSGEPLEAAKVKSGIRANLPIEIVFDTAEVLQAGCEVFVTESDGFLTADAVPGHTILFINDDSKDLTLWSRTGGAVAAKDEEAAAAAGSESPAKAEADIPAEQPAQASEPQEEQRLTGAEFLKPPTTEEVGYYAAMTDDVPPVSMDFDEQKEEAPTVDSPMPSVEERPPVAEGTPIVPTEVTTVTSHISSRSIINVVQNVEGKAVHAYEQPVKPPEPIIYGGTGGREEMINQLADAQEIGPHRDDVPHCRLVFFECDPEELCVAGLTSTPDDTPIAFTWYGAFLSYQDFVKNCARCPTGVRLQTFGHGFLDIRGNDAETINKDITAIISDDLEYDGPDRIGKGQQKGKGKGKPREPSTPPPQRPPRGEAEWSWYNRGWSDREWNQWYSEWHGGQQRGWNWR
ncbi:unnamed protein product [Symbiodinium sp. KB8]|nr:unnamed protein product [Symbiodinium sp. KB8]